MTILVNICTKHLTVLNVCIYHYNTIVTNITFDMNQTIVSLQNNEGFQHHLSLLSRLYCINEHGSLVS